MTKTMKKYFILISAALLSLACTKEIVDEQEVYDGEYKTITFESVMTKTTLAESGEVAWEAGDQISVYYVVDGVAKEAVATASAAGTSSTFTTQIPIEDNPTEYYAAYPAGSGVMEVVDGTTNFYVYVKPDAAAGTFKSVNYSASYTKAEDMAFQFHNAVGMIRLAVPEGGKFSKDGVEYTLTGVYLRGQAKAFDFEDPTATNTGYVNTGLISFNSDGTFGERAIKSQKIGEVTYSGAANINMIRLTADALNSGYVYIPTAPGTWPTGLCVRYLADFDDVKGGALPAVLSNGNPISVKRGEIRELSDLTTKVHMNYYVASGDVEGDGLTVNTPMSLSKMQEMFNLTGDGIYGAYALQRVTFNLAEGAYTLTETFTIPKASAAYSATIKGAGANKTILDGNNTVGVMSIADNTHIYLQDLTIQKGNAANGAGLNIVLSSTTKDTFIIDCDNCIFKENKATAAGGAIFVNETAAAGQVRLNGCLFEENTSTTDGGGAFFTKSKVAFFANKCYFNGNSGLKNGLSIYHNNKGGSRLGLNNCTVNLGGSKWEKTDGSIICAKGYTVIANTTIWARYGVGKRGSIYLGSSNDENGSTIVNCFIRNKSTTEENGTDAYPAFAMHGSYKQNVKYCIYSGISETSMGDPKSYILTNSLDITSAPDVTSRKHVGRTINNVQLFTYTWSWETEGYSSGYQCPSLATVREAISGTSVVGELFLSWLDSLDGALTTDIHGNPRLEAASCPGSYQQADTPNN